MKLSSIGIPFDGHFETTMGENELDDRSGYAARMAGEAATFIADRLDRERLRTV